MISRLIKNFLVSCFYPEDTGYIVSVCAVAGIGYCCHSCLFPGSTSHYKVAVGVLPHLSGRRIFLLWNGRIDWPKATSGALTLWEWYYCHQSLREMADFFQPLPFQTYRIKNQCFAWVGFWYVSPLSSMDTG